MVVLFHLYYYYFTVPSICAACLLACLRPAWSGLSRSDFQNTYHDEQWTLVGNRDSLDFKGDPVKTRTTIDVDDAGETGGGAGGNLPPPKKNSVLIRTF